MKPQTSTTSESAADHHPLNWKTILNLLELIETNPTKATTTIKSLPPGEPLIQAALSDLELKQQILSVAPNAEAAVRSLKELFLRKTNASS